METNKRDFRIQIMEKLYEYDMTDEYVIIRPTDDYAEYVMDVVNYVCTNLEKIDEVFSSSLTNYRLSRLSFVDRAIGRMCIAEMMMGLDCHVAINEALEIIKIYSDSGNMNSVRLMNKVLDTASKKI